ncbi:MAG: MOSC domain-containing protein [Nitrospiraceae bacterium]
MKLFAVNIARQNTVSYRGHDIPTGIFKQPVAQPVMVRMLGLDGDTVADLSVHGGPFKAVYAYPVEHYPEWARELKRDDLFPGQFGENLTVEGMTEDQVHIGDVFRVGGAVLQVTQPRVPCYKLAAKMGSMKFPKLFLGSGRVGYYFRVLEEGVIRAGDPIERSAVDAARVAVQDIVRLAFGEEGDPAQTERALGIPALSPEWRAMLEERLTGV